MTHLGGTRRDSSIGWSHKPGIVATSRNGAGTIAIVVAAAGLAFVRSMTDPLQRFDEGILLSGPTFLAHGAMPFADYYQPYGPGTAMLGLAARLAGDVLVVHRGLHSLPGVALAATAFVLCRRRAGLLHGTAAAIATVSAAPASRYAVPIICLLVLEARLSSEDKVNPTWLGAMAGIAPWFRPEYSVLASFIVVMSPRCRKSVRLWVAFLGTGVAPYAAICIAGGGAGLADFVTYSAFHFRDFRGLPFDFMAVLSALARSVTRLGDTEAMLFALSYGAGALLLVRTVWRTVSGRPDPLGLVALLVLGAQSVRFGTGHAAQAVPLVMVALLRTETRRLSIPAAAVACVCTLGLSATIPFALDAFRAKVGSPTTHRLKWIPLNQQERLTLVALDSLSQQGALGQAILVVNRQNDLTFANDAIAYWVADVSPAGWATTFDPGLTDRTPLQRRIVRSLCRTRGTVLQLRTRYETTEFQPSEFGSRVLDQYLALNYRHDRDVGFYRVLVHSGGECHFPWSASAENVGAVRDELLSTGDFPAAGALAVLLLERGLRDDRNTSIAVLGQYWIAPSVLRAHPNGRLLLAHQEDGAADLSPARGDLVASAVALETWLRHPPPNPSESERALVAELAFALQSAWPNSPRAMQVLLSIVPMNEEALERMARGSTPAAREALFARLRIADASGDAGRRREAMARLEPHLVDDPVTAYETLRAAAEHERAAGNDFCASNLLDRADRLLRSASLGAFPCS